MAFFFVLSGIAAWHTGMGFWEIYKYSRLDTQLPCQVNTWEIKEKPNGQCLVYAKYSFNTPQGKIEGIHLLREKFLNFFAARRFLSDAAHMKWTVWFNSNNPLEASLEKAWPYFRCVKAFFALAILIYFILFKKSIIRKFV